MPDSDEPREFPRGPDWQPDEATLNRWAEAVLCSCLVLTDSRGLKVHMPPWLLRRILLRAIEASAAMEATSGQLLKTLYGDGNPAD